MLLQSAIPNRPSLSPLVLIVQGTITFENKWFNGESCEGSCSVGEILGEFTYGPPLPAPRRLPKRRRTRRPCGRHRRGEQLPWRTSEPKADGKAVAAGRWFRRAASRRC